MEVTTTNGKPFSEAEHAMLALLVYRRFGEDVSAASAAWRRMMQNATTDEDFTGLLDLAAQQIRSCQTTRSLWRGNNSRST